MYDCANLTESQNLNKMTLFACADRHQGNQIEKLIRSVSIDVSSLQNSIHKSNVRRISQREESRVLLLMLLRIAVALFLMRRSAVSFELLGTGCPRLLVLNTFDDVKLQTQGLIDNAHTTSFLSLS
jgi:hypothetical protein